MKLKRGMRRSCPSFPLARQFPEKRFKPEGRVLRFLARIVVGDKRFSETGFLHSDAKIEVFYKSVMLLLVAISVLLGVNTYFGPRKQWPLVSNNVHVTQGSAKICAGTTRHRCGGGGCCTRLIWRETLAAEVGIDGHLEFVDAEGHATGQLVPAQVKILLFRDGGRGELALLS